MTKSLKNVLNKAKKVIIHFSIEAGEKVFKYFRGVSLETIKPVIIDTCQSLNNLKLVIRVTQMPYNIFEYPNVYKWIYSLKLDYKMEKLAIENWVVKPEFLNGHVLPLELRLEALESLNNFLKVTPNCHKSIYQFRDSLKKPQIEGIEIFKQYTKDLDKIRGTNFAEVEPRIGKYL